MQIWIVHVSVHPMLPVTYWILVVPAWVLFQSVRSMIESMEYGSFPESAGVLQQQLWWQMSEHGDKIAVSKLCWTKAGVSKYSFDRIWSL